MAAHDSQCKLMMLAEKGVYVVDCWEHSRLNCCKLRSMESLIRLFWVHRSCSPALALMLVFFNLLVLAFTLGAPTQNYISSSAIPPLAVTTTVITDLYPTTVDEDTGDGFLHEPPTSGYDPTAPRPLPFLKNRNCKLHKNDGRTVSRRCGLRELDLPNNDSGVQFWNPQICRTFHCQCVATKEFRKREKRTVANNKTVIEYRRFRLFECV